MISIVAMIIGISMIVQPFFPSWQAIASQGADKNARGQKLYMQYCASCHGVDGKGSGPVAPSLKEAAPDLTTIAKREGKFDGVKIQLYISGETRTPAHGTKDMPVWGYIFRQKGVGQSATTMNIYALTKYVESIQQK
jgi:mono/diheme cytochrome c family protein